MELSMIVVKDLKWKYEKNSSPVLRDIDLEVAKGEVVLITGASGAGKTTLCRCLNGLIPHIYSGDLNGEISIMGYDPRIIPSNKMSSIIGMVGQDADTQLITMSVQDEIVLGPQNLGLSHEEIKERLEWASNSIDVNHLLNKAPYELSGGQKQRVVLASILAMKPQILILDEPTSEIDPSGRTELFSVIRKLKESGITMVLIEHNMEDASLIADRILLMESGRILLDNPSRSFFTHSQEIQKNGVKIPEACLLGIHLGLNPLPMTVNEITPLIEKKEFIPSVREVTPTGRVIAEVNDLYHTYPDGTNALNGVNLEIREGELLAVIGQNGSGKTTLVKHFNNLLKPTTGTIFINGEDISKRKVAELSRQVGYVFQNPDYQICCDTVFNEIAFGPRNLGLSEDQVKERVVLSSQMVGIDKRMEEHPFFLSKGERQRLTIAAVTAMEPSIIIIDEPTTGQDAAQADEIMQLVRRLNHEQGKTVIIITHDMELVARYCPRTIIMSKGNILLDGSTRSVFYKESILEEAGLRPPQSVRIAKSLGLIDVLQIHELLPLVRTKKEQEH
jgi:energy-coupling factor transport system ATP-binding protein